MESCDCAEPQQRATGWSSSPYLHLLTLSERLDRDGVTLVSLKEKIDAATRTGWLFLNLLCAPAEFERKTIHERVVGGTVEKAVDMG